MFFLGIAGPLMPYFMMLGVLIAFTLGVSKEGLRNPEKEPMDQHIRLQVQETKIASLTGCCHFYTKTDQSHQKKTDNNIFPLLPVQGIQKERKIICRNDSFLPADYTGNYFGLSPPGMFV
jgi:hypothetical protein